MTSSSFARESGRCWSWTPASRWSARPRTASRPPSACRPCIETNATLDGRALARNGAVTLDANRINASSCEDTTVNACCNDSSLCSGTCKNLHNDANHCGACGTDCTRSQICVAGACVACPGNLAQCKDQCADLTGDPFNCGGCGIACAASQSCVAGACSACSGTLCSNVCVELRTDRNNCGACGKVCALGECCNGGACTAGTIMEKAGITTTMCQHP